MPRRKKLLKLIARRGILLFSLVCAMFLYASQLNIFLSRLFSNYTFSIFAFTLPYTYILNLVLLFFLFIRKHWKISIVPLVALVLTTGLFTKVFAFNFFSNDNIEKDASTIKVLTWNVALQGYYLDDNPQETLLSIVDFVNSQEPDIICLQEFVGTDKPGKRVQQNTDSVASMLDMPYHFYSYDTVFNLGKVNHYGNIIFSKYPILKESRVSFDTLAYNNNYSYIDVLVNETKLRIATFHMQSLHLNGAKRRMAENPNLKENLDSLLSYSKSIYGTILGKYGHRVLQAGAVQELAESTETPLILCGDMNDVPSSYAYYIVSRDLEDAFISSGAGFGKTFKGSIPTLRIDYMFYTPDDIECIQSEVIKDKNSDHYPLVSTFRF